MDVEIVKKNGKVFRLSDYGVVQDFVVSSIDKRTHRENIDGRPGAVNYGSYDGDRTITVPFIFKAYDLHDYSHLRDELFGLLDDDEPFYIREMRRKNYLQYEFVDFGKGHKWSPGTDNHYVNGKQYLVRLDGIISPSQKGIRGEVSLEFVTSGLPYAESVYTTKELNDTGFSALAEKYGLVDNINDEMTQYVFEGIRFNKNLLPSPYNYRKLSGDSPTRILENGLTKGTYTISFEYVLNSTPNGVTNFLLYAGSIVVRIELDSYVEKGSSRIYGTFSITDDHSGKPLTLYGGTNAVQSLENDISFNDVKIESGGIPTPFDIPNDVPNNKFSVWNAGNVTIEPEYMYLYITLGLVTTDGSLKLTNKTTGESFEFRKAVTSRNIYLDGMNIMEGTAFNAFRNTNRQLIKLVPGVNNFEITGAAFSQITFNFKFYYK